MTQFKNNKQNIAAIIVAAGRGKRAGGAEDDPKQYHKINGKTMITYALQAFLNHPDIGYVVIVTHRNDHDLISLTLNAFNQDRIILTHGGVTRQESVFMGLKALTRKDITHVLIHDAARPFIDHHIISRVILALGDKSQAVLPALPIVDTLKRVDENQIIEGTVSREGLYSAQTPQGFDFEIILAAHDNADKAHRHDFTDDCAITEWAGIKTIVVPGSIKNIKLTTREDIIMARHKLSQPDIRCGNGYDVHQLVNGRYVTLCGIDIAHNKTLSGHSDADVAFHALTDALLATCGEGDIGDHFPPSELKWKGTASHIFLTHAIELVHKHSGIINHVDISIIAEQPTIKPHRHKMRENLARILNIDIKRCSVKATTNEKIGFIGREEGIAAIATATVIYGYPT